MILKYFTNFSGPARVYVRQDDTKAYIHSQVQSISVPKSSPEGVTDIQSYFQIHNMIIHPG